MKTHPDQVRRVDGSHAPPITRPRPVPSPAVLSLSLPICRLPACSRPGPLHLLHHCQDAFPRLSVPRARKPHRSLGTGQIRGSCLQGTLRQGGNTGQERGGVGCSEAPVTPELPGASPVVGPPPRVQQRGAQSQTPKRLSPTAYPLPAERMGREGGKIITSQPLTFPASDSVINNPTALQCDPSAGTPNYFRLTLKLLPVPLSNK